MLGWHGSGRARLGDAIRPRLIASHPVYPCDERVCIVRVYHAR